MSREHRTLSVPEGVAGERIDSALTRVLGLSRTSIVKLLEDGDIRSNNRALTKSERVTAGQVIDVLMPEEINSDPIPLTPLEGLSIVYNDDEIVVVDKPVGCAAHPAPGWTGPTVIGALLASGYSILYQWSGRTCWNRSSTRCRNKWLMIVAKSDRAYLKLKDMFRDHDVEKTYHALVQGHMDPSEGTIDAPIDRHPTQDHRFAVVADGKESITHYKVIEYYRSVSMVEVELETGRTHQIRVHFSALGHPLVGDTTYGADPVLGKSLAMRRPWLHALELRFNHPVSGEPLVLSAPYPPDLQGSLALLSEAVLP